MVAFIFLLDNRTYVLYNDRKGSERKDVILLPRWNVGDTCYFITNARETNSGIIISIDYNFCVVKYSEIGAIRLRQSRLYPSIEEAESHKKQVYGPRNRPPYDYLR